MATTEAQFIRALERKFRAVEVDPEPSLPPSLAPSLPPDDEVENKCALCRRTDKLDLSFRDVHGRPYCRETERAQCDKIAQGRLGAAAGNTTSASALRGELHPDGNCRQCGAPIKWVTTQKRKKMPVDVSPAPPSVAAFELVGRVDTLAFYISEKRREKLEGDVYESHFQTCTAGEDRT